MNLKKRIEAAKEKRGYSLASQKAILEKILDKLSTIQEGAEQNVPPEKIKETIEDIGVNALRLGGKKAEQFAERVHTHGIYQEREEAEEWKAKMTLDVALFVQNFADELKKHTEWEEASSLRNDTLRQNIVTLRDRLEEKSQEILKELEDLYHGNLKGLKWSEAGHTIDTDVDFKNNTLKNLKDPEKPKDAANKQYVDKMSQQNAIRFMGGGGIHVGATPPEAMENRLWVDTN